jgi:phenylalanyl-tRNA synthetase alpha chain
MPVQNHTPISAEAYARARSSRDLTDAAAGPHAMQMLLHVIVSQLERAWSCDVVVNRADPLVTLADNYDRLHYPGEAAARDARYARYVSNATLLRTHTSAMIPPLLRTLAGDPSPPPDVLLVCPGIVYRRDTIDRLHTGEPHQADLWRIRRGKPLDIDDLAEMIRLVTQAVLPNLEYRGVPAVHPYTTNGIQVDVCDDGRWVEIGECGLALPALLQESGLDTRDWSGLAMGLGLDRLLMLAKRIDDIRLLRSEDPRITQQMLDLSRYRPVSDQPAIRRDLSVAVADDVTAEEIGDRVRDALGDHVVSLETIEILSETPYDMMPAAALQRIGMRPGQKNVLLRIVIRHLERTSTSEEANELRDRVYSAVHEGDVWQWATTTTTTNNNVNRLHRRERRERRETATENEWN